MKKLANWPFFLKFYFVFKLYIIVLVLPNIKMNPPQVYMCSPHWDNPEGWNGEGGGWSVQDGHFFLSMNINFLIF